MISPAVLCGVTTDLCLDARKDGGGCRSRAAEAGAGSAVTAAAPPSLLHPALDQILYCHHQHHAHLQATLIITRLAIHTQIKET